MRYACITPAFCRYMICMFKLWNTFENQWDHTMSYVLVK